MTIEDRIKEMLVGCGMFDSQAVEIIEAMKIDKVNEPWANRWNDNIEGYLPSTLATLWYSAKRAALKYIDANCPEVWFRPTFV